MSYLYISMTVVMTRVFIKRFFIGKISPYVIRLFKKQYYSMRILSLGFVNFYPRVSVKIIFIYCYVSYELYLQFF